MKIQTENQKVIEYIFFTFIYINNVNMYKFIKYLIMDSINCVINTHQEEVIYPNCN